MKRLLLLALLVGCTEPKRPTLEGLWDGTAAGHSVLMRITSVSPWDGSINVSGGPLCFEAGGAGLQTGGAPGSVSIYFYDCIQPSTVTTIQFSGTLSGDTMTGTLTGWQFSSTPVTFTR